MKACMSAQRVAGLGLLLALSAFLFAGCSTTPKVDWNTRVGSYTYDQAVAELGPPDKTAVLSDNRTVADWIRRSSSGGISFGLGTGYHSGGGGGVGVGVGQTIGTGYNDKVLRLVFGADGRLESWSKNY